jgi:hypothetical protein
MSQRDLLRLARAGILWLCIVACGDKMQDLPPAQTRTPIEEHAILDGSFISGDSAALDALLHADLVVQPPRPDSARSGSVARAYLLGLVANTRVSESRFNPQTVVQEGPFAFEQGIWELRSEGQLLRSPYALRWRTTPAGWRVVLWRWETFR